MIIYSVRSFLSHPQATAGLGYDIFKAAYNRLAQEHGQPSVTTCTKASIMTPLLVGDKWDYGSNPKVSPV